MKCSTKNCSYNLNVRPLFADMLDILYKPSESKNIAFTGCTGTEGVCVHVWVWACLCVQAYKRLKILLALRAAV